MKKEGTSPWAIVALACTVLLLFMPNYAQFQLSPLAHLVMPEYGLDPAQFSMLFSAAMIPGILLSLVAGLLCDRFGVKRVVGIVGAVSMAAIVARVFVSDFNALFACMLIAGFVATFLSASIPKIMGSWFPFEKVGIAVGVSLTGSTLAMVAGMGTSAFFSSLHAIFVFTAVLAVIALVAWWLLFKDGPRSMQANQDDQADPQEEGDAMVAVQPAFSECLKAVLKSRNVWLIGVALGLNMAATMCILTFLPQALQATRGFDPTAAGALSSVVTFGNLFGSILSPLICARVDRLKPVAIVFAIIGGAGTAFAWQLPEGPVMLACFFLTGLALSGMMTAMVSSIALLPEIGPVYAGTAGGVAVTLQMFGAVIIPSYVLAPILGDNYLVLYGVGGILCLLSGVCAFALPEVLKKA